MTKIIKGKDLTHNQWFYYANDRVSSEIRRAVVDGERSGAEDKDGEWKIRPGMKDGTWLDRKDVIPVEGPHVTREEVLAWLAWEVEQEAESFFDRGTNLTSLYTQDAPWKTYEPELALVWPEVDDAE